MGFETGDDAAVWKRPDGGCTVSTVDFFPPIVDDARLWGRIAAANAASDIYAMGARPLFALNLVVWPRSDLALETLAEVLEGGAQAAAEGGWVVSGGHTTEGPEPLYGQAVIGEASPDCLLTNAGGLPGQALVLTKPLGSGVITTAYKSFSPSEAATGQAKASFEAAVREMCRLNAAAAKAAAGVGVTAATDVTGFGLIGHLQKLCDASGLGAVLHPESVPLLEGAEDLAQKGFTPGGTERNLAHFKQYLDGPGRKLGLLADPQTSGGLLLACPSQSTDDLLSELRSAAHTAAVVGELSAQVAPGRILMASAESF